MASVARPGAINYHYRALHNLGGEKGGDTSAIAINPYKVGRFPWGYQPPEYRITSIRPSEDGSPFHDANVTNVLVGQDYARDEAADPKRLPRSTVDSHVYDFPPRVEQQEERPAEQAIYYASNAVIHHPQPRRQLSPQAVQKPRKGILKKPSGERKKYGDFPEFTGTSQTLQPQEIGVGKGTKPVFAWDPSEVKRDDDTANATMETKVSGQSAQPKRVGRWTLAQLRQTDGIIPSQAGWNKGDSQKLMTNFGTPRNTQLKIKSECLQEVPEEILLKAHGEVRLQSGTNRYASQKLMTGFGTGRDVCREGVRVNQAPGDLEELPEEKIRASDGIVRLQSGTNKYASQKGFGTSSFGTARRETTKMVDTRHPDYDHERSLDQSEIPLQSGTNKFASQKRMMSFGTTRRETTKIVDTAHPEYDHESSIDCSTIPYQMGSNKYASQKGMTGFGQPRWEVLDPSISWQNRKSQGMVRLQSGTNRFASQAGMIGFGTIRNTTYEAEAGELPYEDMKKSEAIIPSQAGWNKGDSQKGYTSFGTPRDVRGKHLKRIWELEYPEEAEISLDRL